MGLLAQFPLQLLPSWPVEGTLEHMFSCSSVASVTRPHPQDDVGAVWLHMFCLTEIK